MQHFNRPVLLFSALGTLALVVGCSSTPTVIEPTPVTTSPESVAWVDGICGALLPFAEFVAAGPQAGGADATQALQGLSQFLEQGANTLDGALAGLQTVGPSPVNGGDVILATMTSEYTTQRAALRDAKAQVDALDAEDTQTLSTALPAALEALPTGLDPTAQLRADPELDLATEQAGNCRSLPAATS